MVMFGMKIGYGTSGMAEVGFHILISYYSLLHN